jgi:hypothetical protein
LAHPSREEAKKNWAAMFADPEFQEMAKSKQADKLVEKVDVTFRHPRVTRYVLGSAFELHITEAHPDWMDTRVGCDLELEGETVTRVRFYHTGWPMENEHWRISCYCWAMYLRVLRRYLEHGEFVPYQKRLEV